MLEVELTLASSNCHTEMNPSDVGNNDRYVVQEILKVVYFDSSPYACPALLVVLGTTSFVAVWCSCWSFAEVIQCM